ncbi:MAG: co-chaperone GroES [Gammaproteobacteria bacterium]|nr:co-chaperone GroES [Gammaproteobacteria bacterium]NNC97503.1 co-chaperone GroES [Gammaproteobacteria bacterium]NNM14219.1 co-chaperone GroES [Gammaproteobacteria bacterium]
MNIRPLHDRVIVKRLEEEATSAGGIIIPDSATEKPSRGKVTAVGNGKILEDGSVRALELKVGDTVLFGKYSGTEVKLNNEEYLVMREEDVLAVLG